MGLFDWLRGRKKPKPARPETPEEAIRRREARAAEVRRGIGRSVLHPNPPAHAGGVRGGGMGAVAAPGVGKRGHGYRSKRGHVVRVDAAFDGEEHASFLLGLKVECRSSWVGAARWNEETATLTLTIHGKDYDFPGVDFEKATVFSTYNSKGKWFWTEYRGRHGEHAGEFGLLDQMPLP